MTAWSSLGLPRDWRLLLLIFFVSQDLGALERQRPFGRWLVEFGVPYGVLLLCFELDVQILGP
jgi:hypothetical protein